MTHRLVAPGGVAAIAVGALASMLLACQTQSVGVKPAADATTWTLPRTPDGQPDLQGMWLNYEATPFEAPEASRARAAADAGERPPAAARGGAGGRGAEIAGGRGGGGAAAGAGGAPIFGGGSQRRPLVPPRGSMVVDPPNGIVPVMPWAEQKRAYDLAHVNDSWEHLSTWERCITRGPGAMFPTNADSAYQIVQTPGYVTIVYEILNAPRIVPVDGSSHLPSNVRLWNGDSRGHWEGNTLVVDITNYNDKGSIATNAAALRIRGIPHSEALHVVERFTRVSDDTINYEATIEDPKVYTAPWKVAGPLTRDDTYKMYESACHEGNQLYVETTLAAGRVQEKANTNTEAATKATGR